MSFVNRFIFIGIVLFLIPILLQGCSSNNEGQKPLVVREVPEIRDIQPVKPVKIKLKRNWEGEYAWDISGDNADKIIEADKRLKKEYVHDNQ